MATHCWRSLELGGGGISVLSSDSLRINGAIFKKEGDGFPGVQPFLKFDSFYYFKIYLF